MSNRVVVVGLTLFLLFMLRKLMSNEEEYSAFKMVSWNEFVHEMLAKGEVCSMSQGDFTFFARKLRLGGFRSCSHCVCVCVCVQVSELIVRPEGEIAFVRLQPGAIVRGHRVRTTTTTIVAASNNNST